MIGVYFVVDTENGVVPSITSMKIKQKIKQQIKQKKRKQVLDDETIPGETEVQIFRNGLNYDERNYFNSLGLRSWADTQFGRELNLAELKDGSEDGSEEKNAVDEEEGIEVCTRKKSYNDLSMDFMYCIKILKEEGQSHLEGELVLYVFKNKKIVHQIEIEYSLFKKDRLSVDYFGNWTGEITKEGDYFYDLTLATGSDLKITFQSVNQSEYIVKPLDVNQRIELYDEVFLLDPVNRPQSELEGNANPYINFIYVSDEDGSRVIKFTSTVTRKGRIEGHVELEDLGSGEKELLATYWLEKD